VKRILFTFLLLFGLMPSALLADVPPDPGFTRQTSDLILETEGDLSEYRFFLDSPMKVEEIKLAGERTVILATGRGGAMRQGKLIAVPVKDMALISGDLSGPLLEMFIREKKFPNAKQLFTHQFQETISIIEKPVWKNPVYRISIAYGAISSTEISGRSGFGIVSGSDWGRRRKRGSHRLPRCVRRSG
jgi:hypothetical protein